MACYDLDRFRAFVASDGFTELYDLPAEELKVILEDDVTAMQFAFRFLRQVLFGEMSIAMREESVASRRARLAEQRTRLEREAAERLAREEKGEAGFD